MSHANAGDQVGYQVALDVKTTPNSTLLTYCTTGVLLEKLVRQRSLARFTHIILDEVHERDMDTDLLLLLIKMFLVVPEGNPTGCKLVLMSATIDTGTSACVVD